METMEFRQIQPNDSLLIRAAMDYTSPETYYRRFHGAKKFFSRTELEYLTKVDGYNHFAVIAVDSTNNQLAGIARFVRLKENSNHAEMALVVHDPFQGRGLGRELLLQLSRAASDRGVSHFLAVVQGDNHKMKKLLGRLFEDRFAITPNGATQDYLIDLRQEGPEA
jgi:GNAT superfamily N-acetyltransferase